MSLMMDVSQQKSATEEESSTRGRGWSQGGAWNRRQQATLLILITQPHAEPEELHASRLSPWMLNSREGQAELPGRRAQNSCFCTGQGSRRLGRPPVNPEGSRTNKASRPRPQPRSRATERWDEKKASTGQRQGRDPRPRRRMAERDTLSPTYEDPFSVMSGPPTLDTEIKYSIPLPSPAVPAAPPSTSCFPGRQRHRTQADLARTCWVLTQLNFSIYSACSYKAHPACDRAGGTVLLRTSKIVADAWGITRQVLSKDACTGFLTRIPSEGKNDREKPVRYVFPLAYGTFYFPNGLRSELHKARWISECGRFAVYALGSGATNMY